jgi:addiction module HigA family antidote
MAEFLAGPRKRSPTHPGELMREIIVEHLEIPIAEAARRMGVSRPSLYAVLSGKGSVTAEMALRFSRLAAGTPDLYLHMQEGYDLWHAARKLRKELARIKPASRKAA